MNDRSSTCDHEVMDAFITFFSTIVRKNGNDSESSGSRKWVNYYLGSGGKMNHDFNDDKISDAIDFLEKARLNRNRLNRHINSSFDVFLEDRGLPESAKESVLRKMKEIDDILHALLPCGDKKEVEAALFTGDLLQGTNAQQESEVKDVNNSYVLLLPFDADAKVETEILPCRIDDKVETVLLPGDLNAKFAVGALSARFHES